MQVEIQFRKPVHVDHPEAWYKRVKAEGFKYHHHDPGTVFHYIRRARVSRDDDESPYSPVPVLLNKEDGMLLPDGADAQWHRFQVFGSIAFSGLGLDL